MLAEGGVDQRQVRPQGLQGRAAERWEYRDSHHPGASSKLRSCCSRFCFFYVENMRGNMREHMSEKHVWSTFISEGGGLSVGVSERVNRGGRRPLLSFA